MTNFYESATNGMNFDRFAEDLVSENTLTKMKAGFYTAKQLLRSKLRKPEDKFLCASDADFDTKLTAFYSIRDTTRQLLSTIEGLTENERDLGMLLNRQSKDEKEHVGNVMKLVGGIHIQAARARMMTLKPLVRMYHDLDMFCDRAVHDCNTTVEAAEKARIEYRGSLLWMKKMSEELDPETNLEKFRTTQGVVRQNKDKLDKLKEDTLQKVDLLDETRATVLYECTSEYMNSLYDYFEESAKAYDSILNDLQGIDSYEIDVLKILNDPVGLATEFEKEKQQKQNARQKVGEQLDRPEETKFADDLVQFDDSATAVNLTDEKQTTSAFLEEVQPNDEPELIALDPPQSFAKIKEELRPDSPLGFFESHDETKQSDEVDDSKTRLRVGPLSPLFTDSAPVPRLQPPPSSSSTGWVNRVRNTVIGSSTNEPNFMPSSLFDLDEQPADMTSGVVKERWADWLNELDTLKPTQTETPNAHQM
ncbi:Arfaptin-like domain protein [Aphelenchoides besseyi]|nr:Arfaptin-like domain protein [Aphelenchoides besseyi]